MCSHRSYTRVNHSPFKTNPKISNSDFLSTSKFLKLRTGRKIIFFCSKFKVIYHISKTGTPGFRQHKHTVWIIIQSTTWRVIRQAWLSTIASVFIARGRSILYNYWLGRHWIWCDIHQRILILTEATPKVSIDILWWIHIIFNAAIVNNCLIINNKNCPL